MNDNTKIKYNLSRMYEYITDALTICEQNNYNYESIIENMITKHAVNMCIVQLGEHAARIRDIDSDFYKNEELNLFQIKGMRDRITHSYGDVDYKIVKHVLKHDLPKMKEKVEEMVHEDVLKNPYMLYEQEYEDYINQLEQDNAMKQCMKRIAARTPERKLDKELER